MSAIPSNLARLSNGLVYSMTQQNLGRANLALLDVQTQLSTGRAIARASDDPIRALGIYTIRQRMAASLNAQRNLEHASTMLAVLDDPTGPLGAARDLVLEARNLASSQIGVTSNAQQRTAMVTQIDSIIRSLYDKVNYKSQGLYLFGGSNPSSQPVSQVNGGYRYTGRGNGLFTDLGTSDQIPVTLGGSNAIGEISARQRSTGDFNPSVTLGTPLSDLHGARNLGVSLGSFSMTFNGGPALDISVAGATSVGDVVARLNSAIRQYETDNSVTILGPGGVNVSGGGIAIDVVAGGTLTFSEIANGSTGADLGLIQAPFTPASPTGTDLNPRLTMLTPLSAIPSLAGALGQIRITQTGAGTTQTFTVDLSGAQTIDQIRNIIETQVPGVRVTINDDGTAIDVFNEVGGKDLAISDVPGGPNTALALGLRTFHNNVAIADFNAGRGVRIIDKAVNGATGAVDPALNTDFRVMLGNGQWFDVDLTPADMTNVGTVIAAINAGFTAAIGTQNNTSAPALAAGDFNARISAGNNGIAFLSPIAGVIKAQTLNNSPAMEDLGLANLALDAGTGEYIGEDRAKIRVDNVFSHLIALRDALANNNANAITQAGEDLQRSLDRMATSQAVVGSYASRVESHKTQLGDSMLLDERIKSTLEDTDFTDAAARLSQLSTQLQATLQSVARSQQQNLFDFLR